MEFSFRFLVEIFPGANAVVVAFGNVTELCYHDSSRSSPSNHNNIIGRVLIIQIIKFAGDLLLLTPCNITCHPQPAGAARQVCASPLYLLVKSYGDAN